MKIVLRLAIVALLVALAACSQLVPQSPGGGSGTLRSLALAGTATLKPSPAAARYGVIYPEFSPTQFGFGVGALTLQKLGTQSFNLPARGGAVVNRIPSKQQVPFTPPAGTGLSTQGFGGPGGGGGFGGPGGGGGASVTALQSFQGLDHFDQRYANSGNQFSVEPPDQGLCVGRGYVVEVVNDVLRIYDTQGNVKLGTVDLNSFLGYPAAIDRVSGVYGPEVTDPSCIYDAGSRHWFLDALVLTIDPATGAWYGQNQLDIAVSAGPNPTGAWHVYHLDVTNDGQNCPCLGDYPHIGADASGIYITTDNFPLVAGASPDYNGAWVYAFDKRALAYGAQHVNVVSMPLIGSGGIVSYSVWPAASLNGAYPATRDGTQYFMSGTTGLVSSANQVEVWALDGTGTLDFIRPRLSLSSALVNVPAYGDPPLTVPQKPGSVPLAQALNADAFGLGAPPSLQVEGGIATNDSGMKQVTFVNGHLWSALTTAVQNTGFGGRGHPGEGAGNPSAGVAWFEVTPAMHRGSVSASLVRSGVVVQRGANLIFPALTVNASEQGAIAVTLVGPNDYPSAAYIPLGPGGTGSVKLAHAGNGPQDGFTEYWIGGSSPRWGDYGAGVVDASGNVWIASEDIHQSCSYAAYLNDTTCGGTRSALANWSTQITELRP